MFFGRAPRQWSALPEGPAAEVDGTSLLHAVGLGRHARAHPPRALCGGTRPGRARGEPIGGGDRQPERARERKKGGFARPAGLRCGPEGHGAQACHMARRYTRPVVERHRPSRRRADRDGARELLRTARRSFPFIETIFANGGYQGPRMAATVATTGCWKLEIVKRTDAHRFVALPNALDRGANVRLDQPQPAPRPRLRAICQNRCRLRPSRHDPQSCSGV